MTWHFLNEWLHIFNSIYFFNIKYTFTSWSFHIRQKLNSVSCHIMHTNNRASYFSTVQTPFQEAYKNFWHILSQHYHFAAQCSHPSISSLTISSPQSLLSSLMYKVSQQWFYPFSTPHPQHESLQSVKCTWCYQGLNSAYVTLAFTSFLF